MRKFLKQNSSTGLLTNLGLMAIIFTIILLLFFYVYLPITTNHGETLKAPSVFGKTEAELAEVLNSHSLRYKINDSLEVDTLPPSTVVAQYPKADAEVKVNRKIYITMNKSTIAPVEIPKGIISYSSKCR